MPSANPPGEDIRRLVLLRHAKSAYPSGVPDHDRPLAGKGLRRAQAAGTWFRREGPRPDVVLCSDAVRTRQTWEIVSAALKRPPVLMLEPVLYGASVQEAIALVKRATRRVAARDARTLVLVGHEPTMSDLALTLAGKGSDSAARQRISEKYPTAGIAVLRLDGAWSRLAPGSCVLEEFVVPRA